MDTKGDAGQPPLSLVQLYTELCCKNAGNWVDNRTLTRTNRRLSGLGVVLWLLSISANLTGLLAITDVYLDGLSWSVDALLNGVYVVMGVMATSWLMVMSSRVSSLLYAQKMQSSQVLSSWFLLTEDKLPVIASQAETWCRFEHLQQSIVRELSVFLTLLLLVAGVFFVSGWVLLYYFNESIGMLGGLLLVVALHYGLMALLAYWMRVQQSGHVVTERARAWLMKEEVQP